MRWIIKVVDWVFLNITFCGCLMAQTCFIKIRKSLQWPKPIEYITHFMWRQLVRCCHINYFLSQQCWSRHCLLFFPNAHLSVISESRITTQKQQLLPYSWKKTTKMYMFLERITFTIHALSRQSLSRTSGLCDICTCTCVWEIPARNARHYMGVCPLSDQTRPPYSFQHPLLSLVGGW